MENLYDVIVIGGGPAGLTAALYLARARYRVLVVEKEHFGGQITITSEVVNYPGVERTSGAALTETIRKQAEHFGAEFLLAEATALSLNGDIKTVKTSRGDKQCFGILLAAGAHPRMVGFEGEEQFKGHGVAYCATCDGEFFSGKEVFVVGGGFAAAEESVFLTKYASHVTILMITEDFTCAKSVAEQAYKNEKITVLTNTRVEKVSGDTALRYLRYKNTVTNEVTEYTPANGDSFGVFVFAGYEPATELIRGLADVDEQGYVITDRNLCTSAEGLYAAGDICVKSLRQVATAVGDGALAATNLEHFVADQQRKTGLHPIKPEKPEKKPESRTENAVQGGILTNEMLSQLETVFAKMESPLVLKLSLDERAVSNELKQYMEELCKLTDKLTLARSEEKEEDLPCVRVYRNDGTDTGLAFHGVPGGHEFTSFVLGLYNAAGKGQALEPEVSERIQKIASPVEMKVMVSLSCTMCPELVTAAQKLAAESAYVRAEVFDLNHFPALRDQYHVMSVPCLVINGTQVSFGKKNIRQLLDLIEVS